MTRDVVVMKSEYHTILNHAWLISSERTRNKSHYKGGGTGKGRRGHHRNAIVCQSLKTNRHNWDRWKHIRYRLDNNCVYRLFAFSLHEKSLYIISPYDFIMRAILDFCGWMGVGVCVCVRVRGLVIWSMLDPSLCYECQWARWNKSQNMHRKNATFQNRAGLRN